MIDSGLRSAGFGASAPPSLNAIMSSTLTPARFRTLAQTSRRTLLGFSGWPVRVEKSRAPGSSLVRSWCACSSATSQPDRAVVRARSPGRGHGVAPLCCRYRHQLHHGGPGCRRRCRLLLCGEAQGTHRGERRGAHHRPLASGGDGGEAVLASAKAPRCYGAIWGLWASAHERQIGPVRGTTSERAPRAPIVVPQDLGKM
jgi:hypothetical protein